MAKDCFRVMTIVCLCLSLNACTTRLAYNFLDWWLEWQVRDYVSLNKTQNQALRRSLDELHQWHREQELTLYLAFGLELTHRLDEDPLTLDDMEEMNRDLSQFWGTILQKLLPEMVQLASSLSDSQVTELLTNVRTKNLKFFDKYVDHPEAKILKNRHRLVTKNLKPYFGKLNSAQEARLQQWQKDYLNSLPLAYAERLRWYTKLEDTLTTRRDLKLSHQKMSELLNYPLEFWDSKYRSVAQKNRHVTLQMIADINNLANAKQIKRRTRHIENILQDFALIMAQN